MDLRALRYFEAVYEKRNVSEAARFCFVSQPSISSAIQQLESTLNVQLFVRHPRGVTPSQAADRLYPLSKQLTGSAKAILQLFNEHVETVPLRLGLARSLGAERMGGLLKALANEIDNLELTLVEPEEPCDARIVPFASVSEAECYEPIWQDPYLLAVPQGSPLSLKEAVVFEDFEELAFIYRRPCRALEALDKALNNRGIRYHTRANIRTIEYAQALVGAGVGAALLPDWEAIRQRDDLVLKPIVGFEFAYPLGMAYKQTQQQEPLLQAVLQVVRHLATAGNPLKL